MMVPRRVLNLNEIATWFDRLTMSGCAPRNDNRMAPVRLPLHVDQLIEWVIMLPKLHWENCCQ